MIDGATDAAPALDRDAGSSPFLTAPTGRPGGPRASLLLVLWQFAATITDHVADAGADRPAPGRRVPDPVSRRALERLDNELVRNLAISLQRTGVALFFVMLIGVPIGYAMGRWWRVQAFFTDIVTVGLALPAFIWALLSVMWFGFGNRAPDLHARSSRRRPG